MHLSQPALSRSVRRLERELGQELFDRMVFEQLVRTTDLVNFVTDVTRERRFVEVPGRLAVPIADADEHATFYLSVLEDAPDRVAGIFEWAKRQVEDQG